MPHAPKSDPVPPEAGSGCEPLVVTATATEYELRNKKKAQNFILGELVAGGQLSFVVENLPKDGAGCRGSWLFSEMMRHFGPAVAAIQGNWTYGDNLATVNRLTASGMTLEQATKEGFTGKRAAEWKFDKLSVISHRQDASGKYIRVHVLFEK